MGSHERYRRMDAARVHAELTVQDLWLRYVALGGSGDAFDLDGYLQGLVPMEAFQQDVLAQAVNEALQDGYRAHRIPLSEPPSGDAGDRAFRWLLDRLIGDLPLDGREEADPPGAAPA